MFDSLQEGIVVLNDGEIEFMNDLSNSFMAVLSGMYDFQNNLNEDQEKSKVNPLDRKVFYIFEADK